jgi:arginyl-tRNA synthetase
MSSRKGNTVTLAFVYEEIKKRIDSIASLQNDKLTKEEIKEVIRIVSLGAMKFSILKYSANSDISFNLEKSVSLQGDSGPYVQYSYARAKSVLRNAKYDYQPTEIEGDLETEERELLRIVEHFDFIVSKASDNFSPNIVAEYLLDLAKAFNLFYQKHPIIGHEKAELRLALTCAVAVILKQGLYLLGIEAPERM